MATRSWGHEVVVLSREEQWGRYRNQPFWRHFCGMGRRCEEPALYWCCYHYITGRGGRISEARLYACTRHAQAFAKRYGLARLAVVS